MRCRRFKKGHDFRYYIDDYAQFLHCHTYFAVVVSFSHHFQGRTYKPNLYLLNALKSAGTRAMLSIFDKFVREQVTPPLIYAAPANRRGFSATRLLTAAAACFSIFVLFIEVTVARYAPLVCAQGMALSPGLPPPAIYRRFAMMRTLLRYAEPFAAAD